MVRVPRTPEAKDKCLEGDLLEAPAQMSVINLYCLVTPAGNGECVSLLTQDRCRTKKVDDINISFSQHLTCV